MTILFTKFVENKYTKWYKAIVSQAKSRVHLIQGEEHHIIPISLGGDNSKENIVKLTYREHFICHVLLTKMTIGVDRTKMCYAIKFMLGGRKDQNRYLPSSKLIEFAKSRFAEARKGFTHSQDSKRKTSISMKGNQNKLGKSNSGLTNTKISLAFKEKLKLRMINDAKMIENAKSLLKNTILSVNEIALQCGFLHATNFSTWFKKGSGSSPKKFRFS